MSILNNILVRWIQMKKRSLKKWLFGLVIGLMLLGFGCSDESTDTAEITVDTQPPTITSEELTVEYGDTLNYSDLVSVTDDSSGAIELLVVNSENDGVTVDEDNETITLSALGTFEITVSASDESGNVSEAKVSIVVEDHVQPVLSLSQTTFSLTAGDAAPNYVSVANASDNVEGDLTAAVSVDSSKVNYNSPGTYEVTYAVSDSSGNVTYQIATVTVAARPQPAPSSNITSEASDSQVMITRTGECYHTHKCGNGTYFWVSFSVAQSRGLRPCQKCY